MIVVIGCSSGVSQEEYDKVIAEIDSLREQMEFFVSWEDSALDIESEGDEQEETLEDDAPLVVIEDVPMSMIQLEPTSIEDIWIDSTYTNNSNFPILDTVLHFFVKALTKRNP